ncbi:hypothetical protein ACRB68_03390 [Actinomadura sp. RB68]|uniref:Cell wall-active antibiotics response LiaF-like C-terminal domain-containing protein n=2 Tax=Actinomadura macrotermitis TaxID=2585200 RepID=A0A7K0BM99_9ACTN|nr:hypothetical protein [Actinomadura macrotermitis]
MRASDADRDRVANRLREALAEGRITPDEHAERIDAVYQAKTYAELEPVLSDLPADPADARAPAAPGISLRKEGGPPAPAAQSATMVAVFSGSQRKGRWLVEPRTNVTCVFGGVELDFRQAVLTQREVTVNVACVFGGVDITVPPGVRVINSISAVFGGVDVPHDDPLEPDAPVIRLTGMALFGGVSVKRREPGADGLLDRVNERVQRELARHGLAHERRDARRDRLRELREERRHRG